MANPLTIALMVGATALQAKSAYDQGKAAKNAAYNEAQQYEAVAAQKREAAKQQQAVAQRRALSESREAGLVTSRAQAVAAAGGGSALDTSIVNIMQNLEGEKEYRKNVALYEGDAKAQDLNYGADLAEWDANVKRAEGRAAGKAGQRAAFTTAITGLATAAASPAGQSMFTKYFGSTAASPGALTVAGKGALEGQKVTYLMP